MATTEQAPDLERRVLHLPARDIPIPTSVSPEAQAAMAMPPMPSPAQPAPKDRDGWRAMVAAQDAAIAQMLGGRVADAAVVTTELDVGAHVYEIVPTDLPDGDRRVYLDVHGGAFVFGAGECCRVMSVGTATRYGARVWSVDYRMPPDHPFPAGLDDCLAAYRALLADHDPAEIIVGGGSAGGNLAAALVLRARDEGLPMPAAVVLMTPAVDLTASGDSLQTNLGLDPLVPGGATPTFGMYAGDAALTDPYVSPLYGDFAPGFPPTILTTGTRDRLLSDTVRMHRALRNAGIPADLHVTEAAGHGGFLGMAPEDAEIERELRHFAESHWP